MRGYWHQTTFIYEVPELVETVGQWKRGDLQADLKTIRMLEEMHAEVQF